MHNGQGVGSTETGVYSLNGATSGIFTVQPGATIWLPTENEWYKAAYYDPTPGAGGGDNYWLHATQSDTLTNNTVSANYYDGDYVGSGSSSWPTGNALTDVGSYADASYYGTFDQGGNVDEWNDAVVITGQTRGLRGGAWTGTEVSLRSANRNNQVPSFGDDYLGFRVATVPEPTPLVWTVLASGALLIRRKR